MEFMEHATLVAHGDDANLPDLSGATPALAQVVHDEVDGIRLGLLVRWRMEIEVLNPTPMLGFEVVAHQSASWCGHSHSSKMQS